jgi:tetratricopeptide (TPR) repeat protein
MTSSVQPQDLKKLNLLYEADVLIEQAKRLEARNRPAEAELLFTQAVEKRKSALGANEPQVAFAMHDLAECYRVSRKFGEAERLLGEALELIEKAYYADHANVAVILNTMAACYVDQGKYAEAEPLLKRVFDINGKTLSGEHRFVLETTRNLAEVYRKLGKFADGQQLLTKGLKQVETPLGPFGDFQYELALAYEGEGKHAEAEKAYQQAALALEQRGRYMRLAQCLESYAGMLAGMDRKQDAEATSKRAKIFAGFGADQAEEAAFLPATLLRA